MMDELINMDELIHKVAEKTGLSPEQAKSAAEAVIAFLKEKLPEEQGVATKR
jgi:nucleoid DNA-binding protein